MTSIELAPCRDHERGVAPTIFISKNILFSIATLLTGGWTAGAFAGLRRADLFFPSGRSSGFA
jgi:hypothetical protein